jgi:hypothetical protein
MTYTNFDFIKEFINCLLHSFFFWQVRDSMRFVEVVLVEPVKHVVALADAYFFPPFQPSLLPRTKGGPVIPTKLPPRRARLVVYSKRSNETSIWIVELAEVRATTRGGHHRGKVISSEVVPNVQPPMVCKVPFFSSGCCAKKMKFSSRILYLVKFCHLSVIMT